MPEQLKVFAEAIRAQLLAFAPDSVAPRISALPPVAILAVVGLVALIALWIVFSVLGTLFGGKRRAVDDDYEPPVFQSESSRLPERRMDDRGALPNESQRLAAAPQGAPDYARRYEELSIRADRLIQSNDIQAALATSREALDLARQAAFQQPDSVAPQRLVAKALHRVGDLSLKLGDAHGARQNHEQALVLLRRLLSGNPRDASIARELAVTLERVGSASMQSGDRANARAAFEEELRIATQMASQDATDLGWVRFKAVVHIMLGNLNDPDSRAHFEQARQLFEALERANVIQAQDAQTLQQLRGVLQA